MGVVLPVLICILNISAYVQKGTTTPIARATEVSYKDDHGRALYLIVAIRNSRIHETEENLETKPANHIGKRLLPLSQTDSEEEEPDQGRFLN